MALKLSVFLTFVVLLGCCALHTQALTQISNCLELQAINNNLSEDYELANDIDCSDTINWNGGQGFDPIGDGSTTTHFTGTFNGNGKTIIELYINRPTTEAVGLFSRTNSNAHIHSVGLVGGSITGDFNTGGLVAMNFGTINDAYVTCNVSGMDSRVGGIAGLSAEDAVINNVYVTGVVSSLDDTVGGVVGLLNSGAVNNSYATGAVSGSQRVGGLVGDNGGNIINSYATGTVSSHSFVGGLAGLNNGGNITTSYATGLVLAGGSDVGGLAGINAVGTISQCYATGNVSVGGALLGRNRGDIENSYATGGSLSGGAIGGLVQENEVGTINNTYSVGMGTTGLIASSPPTMVVTSSYWNTDTSPGGFDTLGVAKNTIEMQMQTTYVGWDFVDIWSIEEGIGYPKLRAFESSPRKKNDSLSDSAIAGIIVAGVVAVAFFIGGAFAFHKRRNRRSDEVAMG